MVWSENSGQISKCSFQRNTFVWNLPNYFACRILDESYTMTPEIFSSPWFSAFNSKWQMTLIPNTKDLFRTQITDIRSDYVGFFLRQMPSSKLRTDINVKLMLLDKNGKAFDSCEGCLDSNGCYGFWNFAWLSSLIENKIKISPTGFLKLVCKMDIIQNEHYETESSTEYKDQQNNEQISSENEVQSDMVEIKGVDRLLLNLERMFLDEQSTDAILNVQNTAFKAHKAILIARSPVFASMFKYDSKESTSGEVDIPDCSPVAFKDFLLYLYTASTKNISTDNVFDLYYAADKYQVKDLKAECVEYMENHMSIENFCSVMTLSLQHSESKLQKNAQDFFCENVKAIIKTVNWQKYLRDYPTAANELYIKAIDLRD